MSWTAPDGFDGDWADVRRRAARRLRREHGDGPELVPVSVDPERDLLGSIYRVPDAMWGFWAPFRDWHPGVCVAYNSLTRRVTLIKGSSRVERAPFGPPAVVIEPTPQNGLGVPTAFSLLEVRQYRPRRVALLHLERRVGRIEPAQLEQIQAYLRRLLATELRGSYELLRGQLGCVFKVPAVEPGPG